MERTPAIFLMFLISLAVISALVGADDSGHSPWERRGDEPMSVSPLNSAREINDRSPGIFHVQRTEILTDETTFLEDNIAKSEAMAQRLDETVSRLNAEGNDVDKLEKLVADYTSLVDNSKMYFEKANATDGIDPTDSTGSTSGSAEDGHEYLERSRESIIQANLLLRDIFHELKPYLALHARIPDDARLSAEGTGTVVLSGDLDVDMSLSAGKLSYVDFKDDISIEMQDSTEPEMIRMPDMKQELVTYENLTGNLSLSGSGFIMELTGEDISLIARGTGEAELFGNGTYFIGNGSTPEMKQIWIPPLFENN
ncbi:MAG: hypothetical protein SCH66_00185 [Methanolobus sp.]|nr:hypothetical protein [Methanolobus sp.]